MRRFAVLIAVAWLLGMVPAASFGAIQILQGDKLQFVASAGWAYAGEDNSSEVDGLALQGRSPGGEFKFKVSYSNGTDKGYFTTFCAEIDQYIWYDGRTYTVSAVSPSQNTSSKTLNDFGAWLYWGYKTSMENGDVVPDRDPSLAPTLTTADQGGIIQYGLWRALNYDRSEIQTKAGWTGTDWNNRLNDWDTTLATWKTKYDEDKNDTVDGWGAYIVKPVSIAQLKVVDNNGAAQDQFIVVHGTTGTPPIPEPASMAIWAIGGGLAAAGVALKRRRRRWSDENRRAITELVAGRGRKG